MKNPHWRRIYHHVYHLFVVPLVQRRGGGNRIRCLALFVAAMTLQGGWAFGQLQWDTVVNVAGAQGGTGGWTDNSFWFNGTNNQSWTDGSIASFGGTAGTVTVNTPVSADGLNFLTSGYTVDGVSTLTLGGGAPAISVANALNVATISATLGGSVGLTKTGPGSLILSGTNTFTGTVTINAGAISVPTLTNSGVAGPLGAGNNITLNGGTLIFNSAATLTTNRSFTLDANGGTFHGGTFPQNVTLAGVISGPGGLTKTGSTPLRLMATNTFTGPVTINAGFIEVPTVTDIGVPGPLGAGTNININGGAIIIPGFNSHSTNRPIIMGNGGATFSPGNGSLTLSGPITGSGDFFTTGNGIITLAGTNTFSELFISSSTVRLANSGAIPSTAEVFIGGGANPPKVLDINNNNVTMGSLRGGDADGGIVMLGSGTLTIGNDNADRTFEGTIIGTGGVVKIGTGTQTLTGAHTFTGPFTINGGAISVAAVADPTAASPLGAGTALVFGGGTLIFTGDVNDSTMRPITLNAGGATFDVTNATTTLSLHGIISGAGGLTKSGPGRAILSGINSFTGPLIVNGGTVSVISFSNAGQGSSIGAGNSISLNGGGLLYGGFVPASTDRPVTVSGDASIGGSGTLEYKGPITGPGNLSITGSPGLPPGTLILSATNTYEGTTTVVGTRLRVANGNAIPDTSAVSMGAASGSFLDLNNSDETIGSLSGGGGPGGSVILGTGTLTTGGDNTETTYASSIIGDGGLTKTGTGTMTLTSGSTFFGPLNIRRGAISTHTVVDAGVGCPIGAGSLINLGDAGGIGTLIYTGLSDTNTNRTITLNGIGGGFEVTEASTTLTLSGSISGSGGLTKSGPGRLIFPGTSTYTGPTTVSAGSVVLNNGLDTPGGTINVASGATLQARGFVSRAISGAGTITATGNLSIGDSSSPSGVALDGTLDVGVHQVVLNDANTAQLGTTTRLGAGGRLNSFNGITVGSSRTVIVSAGASASISGNFINNGSVAGGQLLTFNNNVSGVGSYTGNVQFAGNLSPGNNDRASILLENFIFTQTTTLSLEIGGLAGSQRDQLIFTGTGVLDGVLNITLANGFQPVRGNTFTILSGGTLTEGFDAINLPALSPSLFWSYSQTGNVARLTVVPEPSTGMVVAIGAVISAMRRRRR